MKSAEVSLLARDVVRLASFYKWLLGVDSTSDDARHQVLLDGETALTVCQDEAAGKGGRSICLAFSVNDVDAERRRLKAAGLPFWTRLRIASGGMRNMSFLDPEGNRVYLRAPLRKPSEE